MTTNNQLDPPTVLWALGNPEGWLPAPDSRVPCITGYRVIDVAYGGPQLVEYRQCWASLEYPTIEKLRVAMAEALANVDSAIADLAALQLGLVPAEYRVPGTMRVRHLTSSAADIDCRQIVGGQLRQVRWATSDEVEAIEAGTFKTGLVVREEADHA